MIADNDEMPETEMAEHVAKTQELCDKFQVICEGYDMREIALAMGAALANMCDDFKELSHLVSGLHSMAVDQLAEME